MLILLAAIALAAPAADVAGNWQFDPEGDPPRTVGSIVLKLRVSGDQVTGIADIGSWPGSAPIEDGKIEGDKITFTARGQRDSTTGKPKCSFVGTLRNDEMSLTMTVVENAGGPLAGDTPYNFSGKKISE
jgi:hypothetical protein